MMPLNNVERTLFIKGIEAKGTAEIPTISFRNGKDKAVIAFKDESVLSNVRIGEAYRLVLVPVPVSQLETGADMMREATEENESETEGE